MDEEGDEDDGIELEGCEDGTDEDGIDEVGPLVGNALENVVRQNIDEVGDLAIMYALRYKENSGLTSWDQRMALMTMVAMTMAEMMSVENLAQNLSAERTWVESYSAGMTMVAMTMAEMMSVQNLSVQNLSAERMWVESYSAGMTMASPMLVVMLAENLWVQN